MSKLTIPDGYRMPLTNNELQRAIELIHADFQHNLTVRLNLHRVSAPLFVDGSTGLNDDLNGVERPVAFDIPDVGTEGQVVHSLAKWKRLALKRYEFKQGTGLYTDMNAIRRDEELDNLHSVYVDQWDWEKHISLQDRTVQYLKDTVREIVGCICDTATALRGGEGGRQRAGGQRAVYGAGRTRLGLHLDDLDLGAEDVFLVYRRPLVHLIGHRARRGDGVDAGNLGERIGYMRSSGVAVHRFFGSRHFSSSGSLWIPRAADAFRLGSVYGKR